MLEVTNLDHTSRATILFQRGYVITTDIMLALGTVLCIIDPAVIVYMLRSFFETSGLIQLHYHIVISINLLSHMQQRPPPFGPPLPSATHLPDKVTETDRSTHFKLYIIANFTQFFFYGFHIIFIFDFSLILN